MLEVPRDVRLQRVKKRSFQKFGSRMLLGGGDLYEREEKFFRFVECRDENTSCIIARIQNKDMGNGK